MTTRLLVSRRNFDVIWLLYETIHFLHAAERIRRSRIVLCAVNKFRMVVLIIRCRRTTRWTGARGARPSTCILDSTLLLITAPGQL